MLCRALWARVAFAAAILAASPAVADEEPALYVPAQAVALPDGALSVLANPAGYGLIAGSELRVQAALAGAPVGDGSQSTHRKGSGLGGYAAMPFGPLAWGASSEWMDRSLRAGTLLQRTSLGLSLKLAESIALGTAVKWTETSAATFRRTWDLGLLLRPARWLSVGARLQALGERQRAQPDWPTRLTAGLALRPLPGSDRVTATLDIATLAAGGPVTGLLMTIAGRIAAGMDLVVDHQRFRADAGTADNHRTSLSLRLGLGQFGAMAAVHTGRSADGAQAWGIAAGARMSTDTPLSALPSGEPAVALQLTGELSERTGVGGSHFGGVLLALQAIADQPATRVVVLKTEALQADWAQVEELRAAIGHLRKSGKKVVWYADGIGTRTLGIAVACDQVWLATGGAMSVQGVAADFVSLAEALTRVGLAVQVVRHAEHKSAGEMFVNPDPSPELRSYLDLAVQRRWHDLSQWVALGRDVSPAAFEAALLAGVVFPEDAKAARLVDQVVAPRDLDSKLQALGWTAAGTKIRPWQPLERRRTAWGERPEIAVVEIEGAIGDHREGSSVLGRTLGGSQIAQTIERLQRDDDVRAIVARIVSPGGSVYGSEAMREALHKASERKPTLASMGGVAASGGFWTSLGADTVFADAASVTGSIGILTVRPSGAQLLDRLGVRTHRFGAGPGAGFESLTRPWTATEIALIHRQLGKFYGMFVQLTATRRGLDYGLTEGLARGRVWFGDEALGHHLIDRQGGLLDALALAKSRAQLDDNDPPLVRFVPQPSFGQQLRAAVGLASVAAPADALVAAIARAAGPWLDVALVAQALQGAQPLATMEAPRDGRAN